MKKAALLKKLTPHFDGKQPTDEQIATALGISRQAVQAWGDFVPLLRQYQLAELFPGIL